MGFKTPPKNAKKFSKDYQPKKNGRKKGILRVLGELLSEEYNLEIGHADKLRLMQCMFEKTKDELSDIAKGDQYPVFMRMIASAIMTDVKNGRIDTMEKILDRTHGKPTQVNINRDLKPSNDEEDAAIIEQFLAKHTKKKDK